MTDCVPEVKQKHMVEEGYLAYGSQEAERERDEPVIKYKLQGHALSDLFLPVMSHLPIVTTQ